MQAYADPFLRFIRQRSDVDILMVGITAQQFEGQVGKAFGGMFELHAHDPARIQEAAEMVMGTKNEELFFLFVPIAAYAAENSRTVIESMSSHSDFRFGVWNYFALEIRILG